MSAVEASMIQNALPSEVRAACGAASANAAASLPASQTSATRNAAALAATTSCADRRVGKNGLAARSSTGSKTNHRAPARTETSAIGRPDSNRLGACVRKGRPHDAARATAIRNRATRFRTIRELSPPLFSVLSTRALGNFGDGSGRGKSPLFEKPFGAEV